ncbi:MAG: hypothetical protein CL926_13715 [Deltaproteobacteria bacterium]|nr:hypothetical protein [Deltaproteobacteria bacterium]
MVLCCFEWRMRVAHTELNFDKRRRCYRLRDQKLPMTEIARVMGRHR